MIELCDAHPDCLLRKGHTGKHCSTPTQVWSKKFTEKDKYKINKAGTATPRGGEQNGYQNHVSRTNKVIIPYEKLSTVPISEFKDGYNIRLYPDQYFESNSTVYEIFMQEDCQIKVGENAFILYRNELDLRKFPPLEDWVPRYLELDGEVVDSRSSKVIDKGHYLCRFGSKKLNNIINEGAPQGIFAPEYADEKTNFLSKAVLAWLLIKTKDNPYDESDFCHLRAILEKFNLINEQTLSSNHIIKNGYSCCPLCGEIISYNELHQMVDLTNKQGLANAQEQQNGITRSTEVNLFHISPLTFKSLEHKPSKIAWGHATCNTLLGQRTCLSLDQVKRENKEVIIKNFNSSIGWMSKDNKFIRSENGDVWVKISNLSN